MLFHSKSWIFSNLLRTISTSTLCCSSHYDILGLTPKATQGDIKSAYYKLSMLYHPDKSTDETSAKRFRAITEAYEVLGNIKLKKMYDQGLLGHDRSFPSYHPEPEPHDPTLNFYRSHSRRQVTPTMSGKQPIYDFDAWAKNHYGEIFRKSQYDKRHQKIQREKSAYAKVSGSQEVHLYSLFVLIGIFFMLVLSGKSEYDVDMTKNVEEEPQQEPRDLNSLV